MLAMLIRLKSSLSASRGRDKYDLSEDESKTIKKMKIFKELALREWPKQHQAGKASTYQ